MKYLKRYKLFESVNKQEINVICKKYSIKNYTINSDGSIDVDGSIDLSYGDLTKLPLRFRNVSGDFDCYNNKLTGLEGAPSKVGGLFDCRNNQLTSLEGLEWKSFGIINLINNPVYEIVKDWINNEDLTDLIEYFIDMNVIQEGEYKPKLILPRLEAFYEEMELEMDINFEEVKKYYEIIK